MKQLAAVTLLLLVSGCVQPEGSSAGTDSPTPKGGFATTGNEHIGAGQNSLGGANMTACRGTTATMRVPLQTLQSQIPSGYDILEDTPGTAILAIDLRTCQKLAVDGVDIGPADLQLTRVAIDRPDEQTVADVVFFTLEVRTSSARLAAFLESASIQVKPGTMQASRSELPAARLQILAEVSDDAGPIYRWEGVTGNPTAPTAETWRHYFGDEPSTQFLDDRFNLTVTPSSGLMQISFRENTTLGRALQGATQTVGFVYAVDNQSSLIRVG